MRKRIPEKLTIHVSFVFRLFEHIIIFKYLIECKKMAEEMDLSNPADEEEQERKLLEESSNDEDMGAGEKIDEEVLESESENEFGKSKGAERAGSNDDDSSDDDDEDRAAETEIKRLESALAQNPYDYDAHVQLIDKLHKMGELDRLRAARENMNSKYPLAPEIWLSWIRDEMKVAVTHEQKLAVIELCERATQDYLCELNFNFFENPYVYLQIYYGY